MMLKKKSVNLKIVWDVKLKLSKFKLSFKIISSTVTCDPKNCSFELEKVAKFKLSKFRSQIKQSRDPKKN